MHPHELLSRLNFTGLAASIQNGILTLLGADSPSVAPLPAKAGRPNPLLETDVSAICQFAQALAAAQKQSATLHSPLATCHLPLATCDLPLATLFSSFHAIPHPSSSMKMAMVNTLCSLDRATEAKEILPTIDYDSLPTDQQKLQYAILLAKLEHPEAAEKLIPDLYKINPDLKDAYSKIAWQYRAKGDLDKAEKLLEMDLRENRQSPSWTLHYVQLLSQINNTDRAQALFESVNLNDLPNDNQKIAYAVLLAKSGQPDAAEKLVHELYERSPDLKDGYARIGWQAYWIKKDYSSIQSWLRRDEDLNRLSPAWRINQAKVVALTDCIENAMPLIEQAYAESPATVNGYAQVAWTRFITEDIAYEKTLPYFERDLQLGRLRGEWLLNYAQALAVVGRVNESEKQVLDAYHADFTLINGFARCAFTKSFLSNYAPAEALPWFERDRELGRLQGIFSIRHATILAALGNLSGAIAMVEQAYNNNSPLKNGYSLVGWYYHLVHHHTPKEALAFFERDEKLARLQPNARSMLAGLRAYLGDRDIAEKMIIQNYQQNSNTVGGYTIVGFCDYARNEDLRYSLEMVEKDTQLGRLSRPFLTYLHAAMLLTDGNAPKAKALARDAANRSSLAQTYAKSWLRRICPLGGAGVSKFITPKMEELFAAHG